MMFSGFYLTNKIYNIYDIYMIFYDFYDLYDYTNKYLY